MASHISYACMLNTNPYICAYYASCMRRIISGLLRQMTARIAEIVLLHCSQEGNAQSRRRCPPSLSLLFARPSPQGLLGCPVGQDNVVPE